MVSKAEAGLIPNRLDKYRLEQDGQSFLFLENGCGSSGYSASEKEIREANGTPKPSFVADFFPIFAGGSFAAIVAGLLTFGICWALGWVAAGFTSR